jgi:hypothetical protein
MIVHKAGLLNLSLIVLISVLCFLVNGKPVDAAPDTLLMGAVGKVEIKRSQTGTWEKASGGSRLRSGDSIRTGAKSQADIRFQQASITLYENSLLEFPTQPKTAEPGDRSGASIMALLHNGHLQFRTFQKPGERFEVMTPTITATGRNAAFRILEKDGLKAVVVSSGTVEVRNQDCPSDVMTVKAGRYTLMVKSRLTATRTFQSQGFYIEKGLMEEQSKLAEGPKSEQKPCLEEEGDETQPPPSFRLSPSGTISKRYDDNIFFARNGEEHDIITSLIPALRLSGTVKRLSGNLEYKIPIEYYEDNNRINEVKHFADLDWTARLSEKITLGFEEHFRFTTDSTEFPSATLAVPRGDAYGNDLTADVKIPKFGFSYRQKDHHFKMAQLADGVSRKFEEQMALPLSTHQSLTQSYRLRLYRLQPMNKFITVLRSHTAGIGLRHDFSQASFLELEGGIAYWRDISDEEFRSEGMVRLHIETRLPLNQPSRPFKVVLSYQEDIESQWLAELGYTVKGTALSVYYSRELILGSGALAQTVSHEDVGIQLKQSMGGHTDFNLAATYAQYEPIGGNQPLFTTYNGSVGFGYAFQSWLKGEIGYNFFIQDSRDLAGLFEFARNQATVGITALLP